MDAETALRDILAQPLPEEKKRAILALMQAFRTQVLGIVAKFDQSAAALGADPSTFERHMKMEDDWNVRLEAARNALKDIALKVLEKPRPGTWKDVPKE